MYHEMCCSYNASEKSSLRASFIMSQYSFTLLGGLLFILFVKKVYYINLITFIRNDLANRKTTKETNESKSN